MYLLAMQQRGFKKELELISTLTTVVNFEFLKAHVHMSVLFHFFHFQVELDINLRHFGTEIMH